MDSDQSMEKTRGIMCSVCRQRFSNVRGHYCPACGAIFHPLPVGYPERLGSGEYGGGLRWIGTRMGNKIAGGGKTTPGSLNSKPSPLNASHSFTGGRQPRKRALLIGITYADSKLKLKGTVNDVVNMRTFLIDNYGFRKENILVLTEEELEPEYIPNKKNILKALPWLVKGCRAGDSLVFYFSGHGVRQPDFEGDERDGFDETICPVDFLTEGFISDNEINSTLVWPLKKGVTLHAIVDACHSGTVLDLVLLYDRNQKRWEDNSPPSRKARKHTDGGLAISISACEDSEVAADTSAFTGKEATGAMTHVLIETLTKHPRATYGALLDFMQKRLDDVYKNASLRTRILNRIFGNKILQKPQLSASEPFDVEKRLFVL